MSLEQTTADYLVLSSWLTSRPPGPFRDMIHACLTKARRQYQDSIDANGKDATQACYGLAACEAALNIRIQLDPPAPMADAWNTIQKALNSDSTYALALFDNVSIMLQDSGIPQAAAGKASAHLLRNLFQTTHLPQGTPTHAQAHPDPEADRP